ncbi:hypothetical protein GPALN_005112 [Globodera pallida]|nr:hypothetical protein GPALN_005112 [Globodera pallida]
MLRKPTSKICFRDDALWRQQPPGTIICFRNCRLFRNGTFGSDSDNELWVRDGKVLDQQRIFYGEQKRPNLWVDCGGLTLAPGFVDIQMNGAFGVDFTSMAQMGDGKKALEELEEVALKILAFGVTAFCPTIITTRPEAYKMFLKVLNEYNSTRGARILGAHFEGPFISPFRVGCHPKSLVIASLQDNSLDSVYGHDLSKLSYVTIAPELPGAIETIAFFCQKGIEVAIGHSDASYEEAQKAVAAGAKNITHLFNAMRPMGHRGDPGIFGLLAMCNIQPVYYGLIADGIHVNELAIQMAFNANPSGAILVTDSIAALGQGNGKHSLGDVSVRVEGHVAKVDGTETLAGSVSSMPHCALTFSKVLNKISNKCSGLVEALKAASFNPANFLGIAAEMGTLKEGSNADFVLIDDQFNVFATFIGAIKCHQSDE